MTGSAKQSILSFLGAMDCFVASAPRNDGNRGWYLRFANPSYNVTRTDMTMDAIFFDLDGTLTDPKPGITRSIQYALQKLDHHTIPTEDELTWCIGPPLRTSFVKLLGGDHSADRAVALYRERFSDIGLYENRVYDGIGEVL